MSFEKIPLGKYVKVEGGFAFKSPQFVEDGIPIIRISNIIEGKVDIETCVKYPIESYEIFKRYEVKNEDILIAMSGATTGKIGITKGVKGKILLNQRVGNFKIKDENKLINNFLYLLVKSPEFQRKLKSIAAGCAQPNISAKQLESIEVIIPPLQTQKKIVAILEKAERLKEWRKEADELTDEFLKSTFLEMFGDPMRNPKGWKKQKFKNIVNEFRYGSSNKSTETGYPILRIPNVVGNVINLHDLKYSKVTPNEYEKLKLFEGDILFVRTNGNQNYVGRCAIVDKIHVNFIYASYLIRARINKEIILPEYLKNYLYTEYAKQLVKSRTRTSAGQYNINTVGLGLIDILTPPLPLQQKFTSIVQQVEQLREHQSQSRQHIDDLFNVLMQKAFKGDLISNGKK